MKMRYLNQAILGAISLVPGIVFAEAPANDDRANAFPLIKGVAVHGTLAEATREEGEPPSWGEPDQTVWYRWSSVADRRLEVRVRSAEAGIAPTVYLEDAHGELQELASWGFPESQLEEESESHSWASRFRAREGMTYWIQVADFRSEERDFEIQLQPLLPELEGDHFEETPFIVGVDRTFEIPTAGASLEEGEPTTGGSGRFFVRTALRI